MWPCSMPGCVCRATVALWDRSREGARAHSLPLTQIWGAWVPLVPGSVRGCQKPASPVPKPAAGKQQWRSRLCVPAAATFRWGQGAIDLDAWPHSPGNPTVTCYLLLEAWWLGEQGLLLQGRVSTAVLEYSVTMVPPAAAWTSSLLEL